MTDCQGRNLDLTDLGRAAETDLDLVYVTSIAAVGAADHVAPRGR